MDVNIQKPVLLLVDNPEFMCAEEFAPASLVALTKTAFGTLQDLVALTVRSALQAEQLLLPLLLLILPHRRDLLLVPPKIPPLMSAVVLMTVILKPLFLGPLLAEIFLIIL